MIAPAALVAALIGCAQRTDRPARERLLGSFAGVLPCADCSGIHTELRLYAEQPSTHPPRYQTTETYRGTRDGERTVQRSGHWTVLRGSANDPDATVYQLDYDRPEAQQNFLRVGDAELRLLDRNQEEIASSPVHSLFRVRTNRR
jgi:copper homeostasis protein (lipoprotein)